MIQMNRVQVKLVLNIVVLYVTKNLPKDLYVVTFISIQAKNPSHALNATNRSHGDQP